MTLETIFILKVLGYLSILQVQGLDLLNFSLLKALKFLSIVLSKNCVLVLIITTCNHVDTGHFLVDLT